jgi:tyrosyl-tRNA synthetase
VIRYNSEWLEKFNAYDFVRLAAKANVARILEREDFNRRYKEGSSISLHEFIYPLLQGYDSVALKADVEMGGGDQKFNLLMGRELMKDYGLEPQVCLMVPILEGLDGIQKMGKSLNNYIGIDESPDQMYGKMLSLPDSMLKRYYDLLSRKSLTEVTAMFKEMDAGKLNPKIVKSDLAVEIVTRYHNADVAKQAVQNFDKIFAKKEIPDDIQEFKYRPQGNDIWLPKLLVEIAFVATTSEGKRMIAQGGVRIDSQQFKDETLRHEGKSFILQCGKRKFAKIII